MQSATVRRLALVAAMVLLVPVWCRPGAVAPVLAGVDRYQAAAAGLPSLPVGPAPAIRRHAGPGSSLHGSRPEQVRGLVAVVAAALLALAGSAIWTGLASSPAAPSALHRRRHAIVLRAPPLLLPA